MDDAFLSVIRARHCKRAFLDRPAPRDVLEEVLRAAANAPSPRNSQMWRVAVLMDGAREELVRRLLVDFDAGVPQRPDYPNRPQVSDPELDRRAQEAANGVHSAKGIARDDADGRRGHVRDNLQFYGAPAAMIFHLPGYATPGQFLEMGLFLQNVMLGLVSCGLASCPQQSVAGYAHVIREYLGLPPDQIVICSLSVGYEDDSAPVNGFSPRRADLHDYTQWHVHPPSTAETA